MANVDTQFLPADWKAGDPIPEKGPTESPTVTIKESQATSADDGSKGYAIQDETGQISNIRKNEYGDLYYPATPQPAAPPEAPTSSGDIDVFAGLAGTDPGATSTAPQEIAKDDA